VSENLRLSAAESVEAKWLPLYPELIQYGRIRRMPNEKEAEKNVGTASAF
jgi:hypothetical protein